MISSADFEKNIFGKPFLYALLIGIAARLYSSYFTFYINSDGVLYINQAKMIFYGRLELLPSTGLTSLSNYSFFIAGAFAILRDWLLAAKFISFLFGTLTLIPVYLLFDRFFDRYVSSLGTLIYALIPVFVSRSADVLRDPVYWFFLTCGIYFFSFAEDKKARLYLLLSCLSFLLATWARVEAFLFVGVTGLFLLVSGPRRLEKSFFFSLPLLCVTAIFAVSLVLYNHDLSFLTRTSEFADRLALPLEHYRTLGSDIEQLKDRLPTDQYQLREFLPKAGNFAWIIALCVLLNHFLEGFFYPFCLVLLLGLKGGWQKVRREKFAVYLSLLTVAGGLLLFGHLVMWWNFDARFLALIIFPLFIFTGYGLENGIRLIENRCNCRKISVYFIIFGLIVITGLPKSLYFREKDKVVFKQIGFYVAERERDNPGPVSILASGSIRQLTFYANRYNPDLILPAMALLNQVTGSTCNDLFGYLRTYAIGYFLWEEKFWLSQPYSLAEGACRGDLKELKRWYHPDTGQMILYQVKL